MVATPTRSLSAELLASPTIQIPVHGPAADAYESMRQQRIRENLARMQKLGIHSLSLQIKKPNHRRSTPSKSPNAIASPVPSRRSSRLKSTKIVNYAELAMNDLRVMVMKEERGKKGALVREEIYTDEHERLLGTCERSWDLLFDGCGADGRRVYDQLNGKTCHQCRQKTLGHRTHCSKCNIVQGQFCGDCLYVRYGENVLEANKNPNWICPVCRGICNCSVCRTRHGWAPTGPIYKKALNLGFKSVAHYLIQTHRRRPDDSEDQNRVRASSEKSDSEDHFGNGANSVPSVEKNAECYNEGGSKIMDERIVSDVLTSQKLKTECGNGQQLDKPIMTSLDSIGARVRNRRNKS